MSEPTFAPYPLDESIHGNAIVNHALRVIGPILKRTNYRKREDRRLKFTIEKERCPHGIHKGTRIQIHTLFDQDKWEDEDIWSLDIHLNPELTMCFSIVADCPETQGMYIESGDIPVGPEFLRLLEKAVRENWLEGKTQTFKWPA